MEKKKIIVTIEEHISQAFEVEAATLEEAIKIATQEYDCGNFVVDSFSAPTAVLMHARTEDGEEETEWEEI